MTEENYLDKLKAIREKYNSQSSYDYRASTEVMYPLSQKVQEKPHWESYRSREKRTTERGYLQTSPTRRQNIQLEIKRERPGLDRKWERNATIQKPRSINYDQLRPPMLSQAHLKRQDNFNHFISDLDKRIDEKQKKLTLKFRENEKIIRNMEEKPREYESQRVHRTASACEIKRQFVQERKHLVTQKNNLDFLPHSAYDKSRSYKNPENAQNDPSKNYKVSSPTKYRTIDEYKKYHFAGSTQAMLSKKLEGPLNLSKYGKDGWNPSKLQSIQNRIQSVLQQCNR